MEADDPCIAEATELRCGVPSIKQRSGGAEMAAALSAMVGMFLVLLASPLAVCWLTLTTLRISLGIVVGRILAGATLTGISTYVLHLTTAGSEILAAPSALHVADRVDRLLNLVRDGWTLQRCSRELRSSSLNGSGGNEVRTLPQRSGPSILRKLRFDELGEAR